MIPDFKTYLKESVWSDMEDRGTGDSIKIEDDVNLLNAQGFLEYLNDTYEVTDASTYIYKYQDDTISIPIFETDLGTSSTWYLIYDCKDKSIYIWEYFFQHVEQDDKLFKKIKQNYKTKHVQYDAKDYIQVEPKTGESSNMFLIEIIEFLLKHTSIFFKRILIKRDK